MKKKIAIVIPTHKINFSKEEALSLKHIKHFLKKYDKFLVLPKKFKGKKFKIEGFKRTIYFNSDYFISVPAYCEMLNTKNFYQEFKDYEYILIYQLDVLVFSDQLQEWCNKVYDYIVASFFHPI